MKTTGKKINGRKVFTYVFLTIAALISLFPFYFMFVSATNTNAEILSATPKLIFGSHLVENFKNLNKKMDILRILMNSTIMTVTYTALSIILHSMAGYALAKFEFKGKGLLFSLIMVTMMIPSQVMYEGNVVYGAVRNHGSLNKKELEITDIIIDIGAVSREDAMAHVACGDPVSFDTDYRELLNDRLCARGLDDRLGGYIILEAAKKAKERGCTCGIYAATTVGEELTKHGAAWCASRIAPTLAVVLDVTYTSDYEGTRAIENGEIILGGGPVFLHNSFSHKMVVEQLEKAARNIHIKYQWENGCGRTCTDADAIHMAGRGIPTTVMSIPLRYMHNPAEVCSMEDVQGCIDVLAEFLCGIGSDICLKPLEG